MLFKHKQSRANEKGFLLLKLDPLRVYLHGIFCETQSSHTLGYSAQKIQNLHDYSWYSNEPDSWVLLERQDIFVPAQHTMVFSCLGTNPQQFGVCPSWGIWELSARGFLYQLLELVNWRAVHWKLKGRNIVFTLKDWYFLQSRLKDFKITVNEMAWCYSKFYLILRKS